MAKSMRSKREKRLRAIRREIVQPLYDQKEAAKLAAQEAALAAPKLPVRSHSTAAAAATEIIANAASTSAVAVASSDMDVEMAEGTQSLISLKPVGGIGKKLKKKIKITNRKGHGKGKIRRKHNV